ncbi:alpha/beta hydrolase [Geodermatophilus sp. SYSU D00691]
MATPFHPDLAIARFLPRLSYGPRSARVMRSLRGRPGRPPAGVTVEQLDVPGPDGEVPLRLFRPAGQQAPAPALLWIHGGGLVFGAPEQDDRSNAAFARELGITVAAVRYRLAPDHRAPAAVEDVYAGLAGLVARAGELGIDPERVAIGGASAGGGLAANLAHLAHDRGEVRPAFQLLVYPMLDDRTVGRTSVDPRHLRLWTAKSNRYGWGAYLGREPGGPDAPPYAVAARRHDLTGLPPAWIGVGSLDLFHDEDLEYARRLQEAGVPCEVHVVPGAFHGFDMVFRRAGVTTAFWGEQARALRAALLPTSEVGDDTVDVADG